ncbi:Hpt domain-containing protein [Aminobacter aganoensis]|uniref:HPt (Histidine-containing phosphotransfer) domain-containing protein n=1 Tax=Aminobacter aganoensis TaxID=83264 RepID=A0A7X0F3Z0_9HYPH|nr:MULTISPECIES: Hpt domain-containing protein [Aminobacter]MBB6352613.1 HPt (histidine-containing phosphotransfer) domain-containing protein [Aminobacter aganoensis]
MVMRETGSVAFGMPGGESSGASHGRPIDFEHLSRQTIGDRDVEREVLDMFVHQALSVRDAIVPADLAERLRLCHALKGAARGVGAFPIADCVAELEERPDDARLLKRLAGLIDELRDFLAAISR